MKPISLCLVQMGKTGLEVVDTYPDVLPKDVLQELTYKSMPLTAKPGDFASTSVRDLAFSSYIFELPSEGVERKNIGSLIAVYNSMEYNATSVKKAFTIVIDQLQHKNLLQIKVLEKILPNLFQGFKKGQFKIEISSVAKISFEFPDEDKDKDSLSSRVDNVSDDIWK
ncbi:MAG: hypothetical protein GF308_14330 [Candidatus Heimdallarchaeota archaeon]|nr:hypothetical protein [Candidatus Heimdallarchaeota archaeon]